MKFFSEDNPFNEVMSRVADLAMLNICWVIGCLPIITIGASTASLYECVRRIHENRDSKLIRTFWHTYKQKFATNTALTLIFLAFYALVTFNCWYIAHGFGGGDFASILYGVTLAIAGIATLAMVYVWPVASRSSFSISQQLAQSARIALVHSWTSLVITAIQALPWVLAIWVPGGLPFVVFFYGLGLYGISAWAIVYLMLRASIINKR